MCISVGRARWGTHATPVLRLSMKSIATTAAWEPARYSSTSKQAITNHAVSLYLLPCFQRSLCCKWPALTETELAHPLTCSATSRACRRWTRSISLDRLQPCRSTRMPPQPRALSLEQTAPRPSFSIRRRLSSCRRRLNLSPRTLRFAATPSYKATTSNR